MQINESKISSPEETELISKFLPMQFRHRCDYTIQEADFTPLLSEMINRSYDGTDQSLSLRATNHYYFEVFRHLHIGFVDELFQTHFELNSKGMEAEIDLDRYDHAMSMLPLHLWTVPVFNGKILLFRLEDIDEIVVESKTPLNCKFKYPPSVVLFFQYQVQTALRKLGFEVETVLFESDFTELKFQIDRLVDVNLNELDRSIYLLYPLSRRYYETYITNIVFTVDSIPEILNLC